jgi:Nucleotidyl transferase AbiEii toxin, Type IV TA system
VDGSVRLQITDRADTCEVDLSYDARIRAAERMGLVNVLAAEELAADKTLVVLGRAAARDFVDLTVLVDRFGWARLFALALEKDLGLDRRLFLDSLRAFDRLPPQTFDLDPTGYDRLRAQVYGWRREISAELERGRVAGWNSESPP